MIEFSRTLKPLVTNKKCSQCSDYCKQHADLKIIRCPSFNRVTPAVGKNSISGAIGKVN